MQGRILYSVIILKIYDSTKIPEQLFLLLRHSNFFFPDSMGLKKNTAHLRR